VIYPRTEARKSLAKRFQLPYFDDMQDWEWEVADVTRFQEFLAAYTSHGLNEAERWSLMEVLVQCVEDMQGDSERTRAWLSLEPLLRSGASLHGETIRYWSLEEESDPDNLFSVSLAMRELLHEIGGQ